MKTNILLSLLIVVCLHVAVLGGGSSVWTVSTKAEVLKGEARGVSISDTGMISLAPSLTEVFKTGQPYIWSSVADSSGNIYLGTGSDGKVYRFDTSGNGVVVADLDELNVTALAIGPKGDIFAGTSPDGKVYRIDKSGNTSVYFDPKEKYIWALAFVGDDALIVATGDGGKLFKVTSAGRSAAAALFFDSSEDHIVSLAVDKWGTLFAGTDSSGLVLKFGKDGRPFAMIDSPLSEVHDLKTGPDGSIYALVLGDSVAAKPAEASTTDAAEKKSVSVEKSTAQSADAATKSRYDLTGIKSAIYRILPDGGNEIIWSSKTITGFSLYAHQTGNGVLLGTSDKGRIYSISNDGREKLALQTGASQISTLGIAGVSLFAGSSNQGSLYRFGPQLETDGVYESAVLDAKSNSAWGRIWWRSTGNVKLETRSGNSDKPDETWSEWASATSSGSSSQIASPRAQYLQWRAVLKPSEPNSTLSEVSVSFLPQNIAPEILSIQVLPTNVGLAANPAVPIDPNIELSGMDPATFGLPATASAPRKLFQRGATSLQWTAEDRNDDEMVYDVYFKQVDEAEFKLLSEGLTDPFISIDGQSLADGRYVFKVVALDSPSNPRSAALSGERVTEPVEIDNSPPVVTASGPGRVMGDTIQVAFEASDSASYLTRAEFSVNGGSWQPVYADDGISDSPKERYTVEAKVKSPGEYSITLRAFDVNGNAGSARVLVKK